MKNLVPYKGDLIFVYESIAKVKSGSRKELLTGSSAIQIINSQYDKLSRSLYDLSQMNLYCIDYSQITEIKEALIHCYEVSTIPLNRLKIDIEKLQSSEYGAKCQYCGVNIPNTFDHYLPKTIFPEFSIHPFNLFPCCAQCNQEKGSSWIDAEGIRCFVNLYFDNLPEVQYLYVSLIYNDESGDMIPKVKFELVRDSGIDGDLFATISHHFEKLDLLKKYENQANGVVSTTRRQLKENQLG